MNNTKDAMYCRLCAELKQHNTLTNLQTDEETCQKVVNKLSRFNIIMDFQDNILPKTVCLLCVKSLERAFVFITAVEQAQAYLSDFILIQVNTVASDSCDENMLYEPPDNENGNIVFNDEQTKDSVELNDDVTNVSKQCDSEVMTEVSTDFDYSVINGNTEEHIIENKHDIQPYNEIVEENTDSKDEYVETLDVEDNKNILKGLVEKELDSESILLNNTVCCNEGTKNMDVMTEVSTDFDYSVINGNTQEHIIENKHDIQPYNEIIEENTDSNDEYVETLDVEDNKNILKGLVEKELDSESILLNNTVCCNEGTKNMDKSVQQLQPQECNSKEIPPKQLATTVYSKTNINKIKNQKKKKQKNNNMSTKNTDTNVEHIEMTWKDYDWKCCHCETLFPTIEELQNHSMQYHNSCNPYQCTDCLTKRSCLNLFIKHVRNRHMSKNDLHYSCYKCFQKFPESYQTGMHKKKVHEGSDYVCSGCNTPFHSNRELKEHVNKYYKKLTTKTPFDLTCSICNKRNASVEHLHRHLLSHKNKKEYVCETCGKCCTTKSMLKEHMDTHRAVKSHPCDVCNASFTRVAKLRNHKNTHSGIKPFTCDHCGKSYRTKLYITNHMKTHMDSVLYPCTFCNKKFRTANYLKLHLRQHTGEKPYSCAVCQRDFTNWSNYNKHMKRIHATDMAKKKRTPWGTYPVDPVTGEVLKPRKQVNVRRE